MSDAPLAVVWGNCQANPIARLIEAPLRSEGIEVVHLPPVYEITEAELERLRTELLPRTAVLISQPIRDEYRLPGCGTDQLAQLLPNSARLVTFPITYDTSAFPYQARAHDAEQGRINAPVTEYHDLRAIVAAELGLDVDNAIAWWPMPTEAMVLANAEASRAEMARREKALDVSVSDLLEGPAMFTLSHPRNTTLVTTAKRILDVLGVDSEEVTSPDRGYLGERQAPIEESVVNALGWPASVQRDEWLIAKKDYPLRSLLEVQLPFYANHPGIVTDTRARFAQRLELLEL